MPLLRAEVDASPSPPQSGGNGIPDTGARHECAACGEAFAGDGPFTAHRVGPYGRPAPLGQFQPHPLRRCLTEAELRKDFKRDASGSWTK